jgi:Cu(I)/Ag(I) efflux system membrane fusion protein
MALAPIGTAQAPADGSIMLGSNVINVLHVQTQPIQRGTLVKTLRVAGTIDDDATRHRFVSAYIDGRIDKLFVNYTGAEVVEGQPLATFYSPMLLSAEQEYVLLLSQKANAALADHDRLVAIAEQRLRRLGLTDGANQRPLQDKRGTNLQTQIVAPVSGTVVQRFVYEGQYVKEGEKLFEIADFSTDVVPVRCLRTRPCVVQARRNRQRHRAVGARQSVSRADRIHRSQPQRDDAQREGARDDRKPP